MQSLIDSQESLPDAPLPQQPPSSTSSKHPTNASYLIYPIKHTFSGVLRRLSSDPPVKRSASASASPAPLPALETNGIYTPPRGTTPPFQPPPLTPLTLKGFRPGPASDTQILSSLLAEEIRLLFPARLQIVENWSLAFSLERDGASLSTLYSKCDDYRGQRVGFVLVVKDAAGNIFGAYLTDAPQPSNGNYYGTGECFLWRASTLPALPHDHVLSPQEEEDLLLSSLPPPPSADTTDMQRWTTIGQPEAMPAHSQPHLLDLSPMEDDDDFGEFNAFSAGATTPVNNATAASSSARKPPPAPINTAAAAAAVPTPAPAPPTSPSRLRFRAFPYSGVNDYLIYCEASFLSVGGGDGHYGLWLDASLEKGVSERCLTFGNEGLSDEGGAAAAQGHGRFEVLGVEVWVVGATGR